MIAVVLKKICTSKAHTSDSYPIDPQLYTNMQPVPYTGSKDMHPAAPPPSATPSSHVAPPHPSRSQSLKLNTTLGAQKFIDLTANNKEPADRASDNQREQEDDNSDDGNSDNGVQLENQPSQETAATSTKDSSSITSESANAVTSPVDVQNNTVEDIDPIAMHNLCHLTISDVNDIRGQQWLTDMHVRRLILLQIMAQNLRFVPLRAEFVGPNFITKFVTMSEDERRCSDRVNIHNRGGVIFPMNVNNNHWVLLHLKSIHICLMYNSFNSFDNTAYQEADRFLKLFADAYDIEPPVLARKHCQQQPDLHSKYNGNCNTLHTFSGGSPLLNHYLGATKIYHLLANTDF
jgi:hypothetical protein